MIRSPRLPLGHVIFQATEGVVDFRIQDHLVGAIGQPLRCELLQQRDRVVVQFSPTNRIQIAKQTGDVTVPTPPKIAGQRQTFFKQFVGGRGRVHL